MSNIIRQQLINFLLYASMGLLYGFFQYSEGLTLNVYIIPIFIFSCLILVCSTLLIYGGEKIYKKPHLVIYIMPQLIGFLYLIFVTIMNNGYPIGYGIDEILWGFLVISTLLNVRAYFARKMSKQTKA